LKEKGTVTEFTIPAAEEVINPYKMMTKDQINEKGKESSRYILRVENCNSNVLILRFLLYNISNFLSKLTFGVKALL
jgi:hypothetical protein